jgi:hypothetical protein
MVKIINRLAIVSICLFAITLAFTLQTNAKIESGSAMAIWLLDEGNGTKISDSSGNANHGELQGGNWVTGPSGSALSLNGVNDRVIIPDSDSLYAPKAWTITAWVYVNGAENGFGHIVGKRAAAGAVANYAFRTGGSGTGWDVYFSRGGWKGTWNQGTVKKDTWLYMTATYDGVDTFKIYENGTELTSVDGFGGSSAQGYIGSQHRWLDKQYVRNAEWYALRCRYF